MSTPRAVELTQAFYDWECRGRGWIEYPYSVSVAPPLAWPRIEPTAAGKVDDTQHDTWLSRLLRGSRQPTSACSDTEARNEPREPPEASSRSYEGHTLAIPEGHHPAVQTIAAWLAGLDTISAPVAWEWVGCDGSVALHLASTGGDAAHVCRSLRSLEPEVHLSPDGADLAETWATSRGREVVAVELGLGGEFMLPLKVAGRLSSDPLAPIVAALGSVSRVAILQVLLEPVDARWRDAILRAVTTPSGQPFFADAPALTTLAEQKVSSPLMAASVRLLVSDDSRAAAWDAVRGVAGGLALLALPEGNELTPVAIEESGQLVQDILDRVTRRHGMILSTEELAGLVHLPGPAVLDPSLQRLRRGSRAAPDAVRGTGVLLGVNEHHGQLSEVRLSSRDRLAHCHVVGASGTGKSTLLVSMVLDEIEQGHGVGVLDPHGDLVDEILRRMPADRDEDVVLIDPADPGYVVGWNVLAAHSDVERELLASDLSATFARLSTSWGDQMSTVLSNAVLAFLASDRGGTLEDLRRFLADERFRGEFLEGVDDDYISAYWREDFPLIAKRNPQAPILTRLNTFLRNRLVREVVTMREHHIDFRKVLDDNRIVLARLSQGAIGQENASLLGNLLLSKIHQVTMSRQEVTAGERSPFFLYVDEFHELATPSTALMFSGVRKYGLGLTVAHQDLYQLRQALPQVERSVLANAFTRICFRVGDDDARRLADGFADFDAAALTDLKVGEAIARVGPRTTAFNLATHDLPKLDPNAARERLEERRRSALERWGVPRQEGVARTPTPPGKKPIGSAPRKDGSTPAKAQGEHRPKLDKETLDYLEHVARHPFTAVSDRNDELGLSAWKGQRIKQSLIDAGQVQEVTINPGGRGKRFKLLDLAEAGREVLANFDIALSSGHGRGGLPHQWWVRTIADWLASNGIEATLEDEALGARVDLAFAVDGKQVAIEVEMSEGHETANIEKDRTAGYDRIVTLVDSGSQQKRLSVWIEENDLVDLVSVAALADFQQTLAPHLGIKASALRDPKQNKETTIKRPPRPTASSSDRPPEVDDVYIPERGVLTTPMAASYLGLSPATLETMRTRGGGPVFAKLGRRVVYRREDLDSWVEERRRRSTSDDG